MVRIRPQPATPFWSHGASVPRFAATAPFAKRKLPILARWLPLAGFAMPTNLPNDLASVIRRTQNSSTVHPAARL